MLNTSPTPHLRYSYEEFADHMKAMSLVRRWEYTSRFGHLGGAQTSQANNARVLEYFSDSYEDQSEAVRKAEVFLSVCDYIGRQAAWFSRKGMLEETEGDSFSVEPSLLRAVHHVCTVAEQPATVPPRKVLALARAFKEIEPAG